MCYWVVRATIAHCTESKSGEAQGKEACDLVWGIAVGSLVGH